MHWDEDKGWVNVSTPGLSIRDWFAGQALAALGSDLPIGTSFADFRAKAAYEIADAMLEERKKKLVRNA
jgi:hypothetical protein